jgi:hypothetical protein
VARDVAGGAFDGDEVGFAGGSRRRADAHEENLHPGHCLIRLNLESQPPGGDLVVDELLESGLEERAHASPELTDLLFVSIQADHFVTE